MQTSFKVCGEAEHGSEAIQRPKELQPDLVLIDLSMPVLRGAEAASVIKNVMPNTKTILFSLHMNDVPKALAAKIGVDLTLSKMVAVVYSGEE